MAKALPHKPTLHYRKSVRIAFAGTLVAFQVLLIFVHLAVYETLSAAFGFDSTAMRVAFILLALTFVTASLIVHWSRNRIAQWYYAFAAYWFGLVHFLFVGGVLFFFVLFFATMLGWYINLFALGIVCFVPLFFIHSYGTWNSGRAQITRVSAKLPGISAFWKEHPLVFVSDVHLGAIRKEKFARKVVDRINAIAPAVVLIGGDMYDGVRCDAEKIVEPFGNLTASHGVHYVTGNHEFYGQIDRYMAAIQGAHINILENEKIEIEGLEIVGVDYEDTHNRKDFEDVLSHIELSSTIPAVLMKHEPDNLDVAVKKGFALGFFGHTHRGQIYPLTYITKQMYNGFDYGFKQFEKMWVCTSSGVGTWGPPLRLGTRSEIVAVTFS